MILQGIAHGIIADGGAVVLGQLVLPVGIPVGIAVGLGGRSADAGPRLVGVLLHRGQVASQVVGIGDGLVQVLIVLPNQLVQAVVIVLQLQGAALFDRLYIPQNVIGIDGLNRLRDTSPGGLHGLGLGSGHHTGGAAARTRPEAVARFQPGAGIQGQAVGGTVKLVIAVVYNNPIAVQGHAVQQPFSRIVVGSVGIGRIYRPAGRGIKAAAGYLSLGIVVVTVPFILAGDQGREPAAAVVLVALLDPLGHILFQTYPPVAAVIVAESQGPVVAHGADPPQAVVGGHTGLPVSVGALA